MDFTKFDSRAAASIPRDLHLVHPVTGKLLYDDGDKDKPCIVSLIGTESQKAQRAMAALARDKVKTEKAKAEGAEISELEALHKALSENAKTLIVGFKNVDRGDKPATADDADWFFGLNMINGQVDEKSFVEQVTDFATKRANFLGNA